jgi:hypothetical protein
MELSEPRRIMPPFADDADPIAPEGTERELSDSSFPLTVKIHCPGIPFVVC